MSGPGADGSALDEVTRELDLIVNRALADRADGYTALYFALVARLADLVKDFNGRHEALMSTPKRTAASRHGR